MKKLNRAQKCSNLGPHNLGSRGDWVPPPGSTPAQTETPLGGTWDQAAGQEWDIIETPLPPWTE